MEPRTPSLLERARLYLPLLLTVLLAVLGGSSLALVIADDDPSTPDRTITVLQAPPPIAAIANQDPAGIQPDITIKGADEVRVQAPGALVQAATDELEQDLRQDTPTPPAAAERAAPLEQTVEPLPTAGAVQGFAGCKTRILPVNWSSRNGARALVQVDHYTVSYNISRSWADVNAIWNLFANPGRQASSNFIIDAEGHCYYTVPIEGKAWTQAAGNPWSISYEIVAFGNEPDYLQPAGWAKLRSVQRQVAHRTGIPLRRGTIGGGCVPATTGIVQHKDFGLCGGGHVDITPFSIATAVAKVAGAAPVLVQRERKHVASVRRPKGTGHTRRYWCGRLGRDLARIAHGQKHRRPARRRILRRVRRGNCPVAHAAAGTTA